MFELWIYPRGSESSAIKIWPQTSEAPEGFIREAGEYIIEARGSNTNNYDLFVDDQPVLALRSIDERRSRWLWKPGFYAGFFEASIKMSGRRIWSGNINIDSDHSKLTKLQFNQMVSDILSDTYALFSISSARKGVARGAGGQVPPIARLEFIRSKLQEIEFVIKEINSSPVRILASEEKRIASGKPVQISSSDLTQSFRKEIIRQIPPSSPLYDKFNGYFPEQLRIKKRRTQLDINEHRSIKSELKSWSSWLNMVAYNLCYIPLTNEDNTAKNLREEWSIRCRKMSRQLLKLLQLPVFSDVSEINQPIVLTSIFRWVVPYRKFFNLCRDMRLGLAKISGDFLNVPIAKTYELYELWVLLKIIRASIKIFNLNDVDVTKLFIYNQQSDTINIAASSVNIKLTSNILLCFQKTYEEYWLSKPVGSPGSFSRKMIPDMSLEINEGEEGMRTIIVLDAKYRVDQQLNDAVSTLHTYRDAIVQEILSDNSTIQSVKSAYLVTPHIPSAEVYEGNNSWKNYIVPSLLFHPVYRKNFHFGALTLYPGMQDISIVQALKQVFDDAGIAYPNSTEQ